MLNATAGPGSTTMLMMVSDRANKFACICMVTVPALVVLSRKQQKSPVNRQLPTLDVILRCVGISTPSEASNFRHGPEVLNPTLVIKEASGESSQVSCATEREKRTVEDKPCMSAESLGSNKMFQVNPLLQLASRMLGKNDVPLLKDTESDG